MFYTGHRTSKCNLDTHVPVSLFVPVSDAPAAKKLKKAMLHPTCIGNGKSGPHIVYVP